jgi:hypothetical protein
MDGVLSQRRCDVAVGVHRDAERVCCANPQCPGAQRGRPRLLLLAAPLRVPPPPRCGPPHLAGAAGAPRRVRPVEPGRPLSRWVGAEPFWPPAVRSAPAAGWWSRPTREGSSVRSVCCRRRAAGGGRGGPVGQHGRRPARNGRRRHCPNARLTPAAAGPFSARGAPLPGPNGGSTVGRRRGVRGRRGAHWRHRISPAG